MSTIVERLARIHQGFRGVEVAAAVHRDDEITFATLYARSCALAEILSNSRNPVLIRGHKSTQILTAIWACLLTARAYVPVEPEIPVALVADIAKSCGADLILTTDQNDELKIEGLTTQAIHDFNSEKFGFTALPRADRDPAYVLYSSGTTGNPKGIQIAYNNLVHFIDWLDHDLFASDRSSAISGNVRYCFDVSLFELWVSWLRRSTLSVLDNADFSNSRLSIARYRNHGIGLWVSTPSTLQLYLRDKSFNAETLPSLKTFLFCGEVLPKPAVAEIFKRFPGARVINTYGPTECTVAVTATDILQHDLNSDEALPIGTPRPGCNLSVENGQIMIKGQDVVGLGYVGLPKKTADAFPAFDCYLTGDVGSPRTDGQWMFSGRADREIKVQGVRIDLNEIEATIQNIPGIEVAHVCPHFIRSRIRAMKAYVCGPKTTDDLNSAARLMAESFPPWMIPRFWYACSDFPVNRNSKLDRTDLVRHAEAKGVKYVYG